MNYITNVIYKHIDRDINILYDKANSIFDLIMSSQGYRLFNSNLDSYYYYDLYFSNAPIQHSEKISSIKTLHLKDIVYIHNNPPKEFKKEDLALVKTYLKNTKILAPNTEIVSNWGLDDIANIVPYGLPLPQTDIVSNKSLPVLVINLSGSEDIERLYQYIKNEIPATQMMTSQNIQNIKSLDDMYNIFNQYAVCIDVRNYLNLLIPIYVGCRCITSSNIDNNAVGVVQIFDYTKIIDTIKRLLSEPLSEQEIEMNKQYISKYFPLNKFNDTMLSTLTKIKNEDFFIL